jgi:hypothetical protein
MRRVTWATPVVLLVLAAGCGLLGRYFTEKGERLDRFGIVTEAVIVEQGRSGRSGHSAEVTFVTGNGERPEVACDTCSKDLRKGERVNIRYDPGHPWDPVEQAGSPVGPSGALLGWGGAAVLLALSLLTAWLRVKRFRAARRQ